MPCADMRMAWFTGMYIRSLLIRFHRERDMPVDVSSRHQKHTFALKWPSCMWNPPLPHREH